MKKLLAVICTTSSAVFWISGGLAILAWFDKHVLFSAFTVMALLALALSLWTRRELHTLAQNKDEPAAGPEPQARI